MKLVFLSMFLSLSVMSGLQAQKVKVKKDILYIDNQPTGTFQKDGKHATFLNMDGEVLLEFHYSEARPYEQGPELPHYQVVSPALQDSFITSHIFFHNHSRKGDLIAENGLVRDGKVDPAGIARCKEVHDQRMVQDFLDKHALSLTKLVRRYPGYPYYIKNLTGKQIEKDRKYYIATGDLTTHAVVGYAKLVDHDVSGHPYYRLNFYLPDGQLAAMVEYSDLNTQHSKLYTYVDRTFHDHAGRYAITPEGILDAVKFLVTGSYL
ncbi:MAG: hypothetical protein H6568_14325 [Lewinellaceae bacterium]|nr:hypothetical protein [Saprospiraceae bacterium]MCB9313931.1 hypothetical protein [Lewinellaceae bacterium]HRW75786.1 hypothetical protein [Saprospiraceae bacterium]